MFYHVTTDATRHQHATVDDAVECEADLQSAAAEAAWELAYEAAWSARYETDDRARAETDEEELAAAYGLPAHLF